MTIVRAVLKRMHSPDVPNLEAFIPEDANNFSFLLQAMFGPENAEGEESFDILVCTSEWLRHEIERDGIVAGRHYLFVREYNYSELRAFLDACAKKSVAETWRDVATILSRVGRWEFEDYSVG